MLPWPEEYVPVVHAVQEEDTAVGHETTSISKTRKARHVQLEPNRGKTSKHKRKLWKSKHLGVLHAAEEYVPAWQKSQ